MGATVNSAIRPGMSRRSRPVRRRRRARRAPLRPTDVAVSDIGGGRARWCRGRTPRPPRAASASSATRPSHAREPHANTTAFVDTCENGTFGYRVVAFNAAGDSAFTPWMSATVTSGTGGHWGAPVAPAARAGPAAQADRRHGGRRHRRHGGDRRAPAERRHGGTGGTGGTGRDRRHGRPAARAGPAAPATDRVGQAGPAVEQAAPIPDGRPSRPAPTCLWCT